MNLMTTNLIRLLKYRAEQQRQSSCVIVTGKKGSGKSLLSLRLSECADKNFTLEHTVFSSEDLFALLDKGVPVGTCIVYDDAGIGSGAKDAMTRLNKKLGHIMQSIRTHRIILFITVPSWGLLDSQTRNLADFKINVLGHDIVTRITKFKFFTITPSDYQSNPITKHLQFTENGAKIKYIIWIASAPSEQLAEEYKKRRDAFGKLIVSDANQTAITGENIRFGKGKPRKEKKDIYALVDEVVANPQKYKAGDYFNSTLIREKFEVGEAKAKSIIQLVKAKLLEGRTVYKPTLDKKLREPTDTVNHNKELVHKDVNEYTDTVNHEGL